MPVNIYPLESDDPNSEFVEVEHICEGCGGTVATFKAFAESVDTGVEPLHFALDCAAEAQT